METRADAGDDGAEKGAAAASRAGATTAAPARPAPTAPPAARARRFTWRVATFLVALVLVVALAVAAIGWYARHTYYVGLSGDSVAIFKGRPGGLLWFDPTLDRRTTLHTQDVLPSRLDDLRSGKQEATLADAQRYVNNLRQEAAERGAATTTTTTPPAAATTIAP